MMLQVVVQQPDIPVPPMPPMLPPWMTLPPQVTLLIVIAMVAGATIVLWPLMRAIARRIEGKRGETAELEAEVEQLRVRLAELEHLHGRLGDLEERVDFTERLLSQKRDPERLRE